MYTYINWILSHVDPTTADHAELAAHEAADDVDRRRRQVDMHEHDIGGTV